MEQGPLQDALIYLTAAVFAVPLAKRLGLGSVLGYLLAGAAIGPWGLRLVSDVQAMLHFSEFGVVLLLFLIGLELEPKRLWALRRSIFGGGAAQVILVSAALCIAAIAAGVPWKIALIASLGLSLSSTAIALATLQERNLAGTPAGTAGFGILLFQDIAAIPMIALVPLLGVSGGEQNVSGWQHGLLILGVVTALVVGGRLLLRPTLRFIAATNLREIFTAFALLLVIAIALLMRSVGMSMALGTFLAGVLLADSEYRHALETDIEPFKGLLLGLFFISVGMSVDFGVLLGQPWRILGLVGAFLVIKIAVLYAMGGRLGIAHAQRPLFATLLSQGGEFAFVVYGAAATARVFDQQTASMLVVAVTLSMVATPLLLLLHDRLLAPRLARANQRPEDHVDAGEEHVIIAGFGRFGQIIGRLLHANRIRLTVLDHDPDQIDLLRRFGWEVYYGDATRIDLLHAAGAERARALVVAIDDVEDSLALVDAAREAFPNLPILARARNVSHYYDLMDRGVTIIERETFESALLLGRRVLQQLGFGAWRARQAAMKFRDHNLKSLQAVYPYYRDQKQFVSMSKQARDELEEMFARDLEAGKSGREDGWD
jgi:glutathione-regulated potassium-efflux system ancillary protein KefC